MVPAVDAARAVQEGNGTRTVSVLSLPVAQSALQDPARQRRLQTQLRAHAAGVVCLQGVNPDQAGKAIAAGLAEDGYKMAYAVTDAGEANTICWNAIRWSLWATHKCGSSIAVDLQPLEDPSVLIRVACLKPSVEDCMDAKVDMLLGRSPKLIACVDGTNMGGAESIVLVEGLQGLKSAAQEALGKEIAAIKPPVDDKARGGPHALWYPGTVLYNGMELVSVLSGHTEEHLVTMTSAKVAHLFPGGCLPHVVVFDWAENGNIPVTQFQ